MRKRLIIFLIRRKLKVKKWQYFTFENQKNAAHYYFTNTNIMKEERNGYRRPSNVSLNWLLCKKCAITKLDIFVGRVNHN